MDNNQYFASKPSEDAASILDAKVKDYCDSLYANDFLEKLRSSYFAYHGVFYEEGHSVTFGGEMGELVNFPVNHYRNIATHMLNMTVSNRPAIDCRATNTDYKSLVQTYLANNILDYYLREKKLEVFLKKAVEYAIVYGAGFVVMEWDATRGELVDYIEETKTKIYEGDIIFENLTPFDVVYDGTKETGNHDWVLVRRWKNKFDLAAKYPEFADKIKSLETKSDMQKFRVGFNTLADSTDDVAVMEFYHNRTESLPDGRFMMFLAPDIVLQDVAMPYRVLPVFRITPADIHGTPHGYTPMFDLLPLQEILNSLYSTVSTNQTAFGVQNVLNPRGSDISVNQLAGGLNVIDYNPVPGLPNGGKPEPLNLTNTPAEIFKMIDMVKQDMETLSGINSVARGQPEASLKSGTALALVQSMALQFISGLQESYVMLVESVGTSIIKMLQDFAHTPRIVAIAGKTNRAYIKEFSSKDISNISRVVVDIGNPMARTVAGRSQMAQELLQYGQANQITPEQYISLIHTGNLNSMTEDVVREDLLIRGENEAIIDGDLPNVVFTESHKLHIDGHRSILFDPELKKDAELVSRVQQHIQMHIEALRTTDPDTLILLNQQPLQPQMPPGPPGAPQGGPAPQGGGSPSDMMQMPSPQSQPGGAMQDGSVVGPGLPGPVNIPQPAQVPASLLGNPGIQQQALGNVNFKK